MRIRSSWQGSLLKAEIAVAQLAERAVGPDLGGADRALEDFGDFGEGQLAEAAQEEHLPLPGIEAGERPVKHGPFVARHGLFVSRGAVIRMVLQFRGIGGRRHRRGLAEVIGGRRPGHVVHPRGEPPVVAVGVAVLQHAMEHVLGDVFGGRPVSGQFDQEAEKGAVVAFEQLAERVEIAVADGQHQGVIGKRVGAVHVCGPRSSRGLGRLHWDFDGIGDHGDPGAWLAAE